MFGWMEEMKGGHEWRECAGRAGRRLTNVTAGPNQKWSGNQVCLRILPQDKRCVRLTDGVNEAD
jgi:hypothetical protein